ncbi:ribosome biogenesis GTPase YlqF [archaeon]|nr:MAG: ribosome biogenesis GTPase YlqF [archaeon]
MKTAGGKLDGRNLISWYPGHIAKAERELAEYLKKVDVVIEVIDARIPFATTHPIVPQWVGSKPLIVAVARLDQVSTAALKEWKKYYTQYPVHPERPDAKIYFINGKLGAGVLSLKRQALKAGEAVNERRMRRGIQPRAVRAAVIGFPNVGKSALINRLLGKKMAKSRNLPGVTRALQWVRVGGLQGPQGHVLELLDSPGIIPARQFDQDSALKLAICNDIGEASYDRVVVAAAMCDQVNSLFRHRPSYVHMQHIEERYKIPFRSMTGEEIVYQFAEERYKGNSISAADKLLGDFRKDMLKYASLEAPPLDKLQLRANVDVVEVEENFEEDERDLDIEEDEDRDLESASRKRNAATVNLDIGRGDYNGW